MASELRNDATAAARAGARLWIGIPGTSLDAATRAHVARIRPGGVVLFRRNLRDAAGTRALVAELRALCGASLHVAVDQEGGRVVRIDEGGGATVFPGNMALGAIFAVERGRALALARAQACATGHELRALGIDVDLAPCIDTVPGPPGNLALGTRSFGASAGWLGWAMIVGQAQGGVLSCAKHFPGLGYAHADPHHELPRIAGDVWRAGLAPFEVASANFCPLVMSTHVVVESLDPERAVTFSRRAVELLRDDVCFDGVLLTDDLEMEGAISAAGGSFDDVVRGAVESGHDVLLICSDAARQARAHEILVSAYEERAAWLGDVDATHRRIAALGLGRKPEPLDPAAPTGPQLAEMIAAECVTLLRDAPGALPLEGAERALLVLPPEMHASSEGDDPLRGESLAILIAELRTRVRPYRWDAARAQELTALLSEHDAVVVTLAGGRLSDAEREVAAAVLRAAPRRVIFLLLGDPADLALIPATAETRAAVLTAYGFRPAQQRALAAVLRGDAPPRGRAPIAL